MYSLDYKILLFGCTPAAIEIAFHLRGKGYEFVIIDDNEDKIQKAKEYNFAYVILDYSNDEILKKIGIGKQVELIFSLFLDDSKNIFLTISARAISKELTIISITQIHDTIHKLKAAGANAVIDPYQISGKKIYEIIKKPEITKVMDGTIFGDHDISIVEIEITKDSTLNGKILNDLNIKNKYNLIVLGIYDKELKEKFYFITDGKRHKLDSGDVLAIIGENDEIQRFKKDYLIAKS